MERKAERRRTASCTRGGFDEKGAEETEQEMNEGLERRIGERKGARTGGTKTEREMVRFLGIKAPV